MRTEHLRWHTARIAAALALAAGLSSVGRAQAPAGATAVNAVAAPGLSVGGDVATPMTFAPEVLKTLPRTKVTVTEESGKQTTYEGVLVTELLKRAGVALGRDLSGKAVASYVLASARDGYQVVFSLAELDNGFTSNDIIVADSVNGSPLFDYQGPLRLVAPHDKRGARSIRMIEKLELVRLRK